jgi:MYXO-CTERM domain-containing protein
MPEAAWPGKFFHRHDFAPEPRPFKGEPHPEDAHVGNRPASFSQDWPDRPAHDGRMEVAVATADGDEGFGWWHMRRMYRHAKEGAGGVKMFGEAGKAHWARPGGGGGKHPGHLDGDDAAGAGEQMVPFVKAEEILGGVPGGAQAAHSEIVRNDDGVAPVYPAHRRSFGFEVAPVSAAAWDAGAMSAPPIAFVQAPEPGALGVALGVVGVGLLRRRRRRRH